MWNVGRISALMGGIFWPTLTGSVSNHFNHCAVISLANLLHSHSTFLKGCFCFSVSKHLIVMGRGDAFQKHFTYDLFSYCLLKNVTS